MSTGRRLFTTTQAAAIRRRYAAGESTHDLAEAYDVSPPTIWLIVEGVHYREAGGPTGARNGQRLTARDIVGIRKRYAAGEKQVDLADEHGVTQAQIGRIVRGERWPDAGGPITDTSGTSGSLSAQDVVDMRTEYARGGWSYAALGDHYGVSPSYTGQIVRGDHRREDGGPIKGEDY